MTALGGHSQLLHLPGFKTGYVCFVILWARLEKEWRIYHFSFLPCS